MIWGGGVGQMIFPVHHGLSFLEPCKGQTINDFGGLWQRIFPDQLAGEFSFSWTICYHWVSAKLIFTKLINLCHQSNVITQYNPRFVMGLL